MPVISTSSSTGEIGQGVARGDAVRGELARDRRCPCLRGSSASSTFSTLSSRAIASVSSALRARDAQLVHGVLVERFDLEHLGDRHIGDFLERREAFVDQDVGDFLVDVELLDEQARASGRSRPRASAAIPRRS